MSRTWDNVSMRFNNNKVSISHDLGVTYTEIEVHCNLLSDSILSGKESDILFQFSVDDIPPSFPFKKEGKRLLFCKLNTNRINL